MRRDLTAACLRLIRFGWKGRKLVGGDGTSVGDICGDGMSRAELLTSQHLQLRLSDLLEATWLVKPGLAATSAILSRNMPKYPNIFEVGSRAAIHAARLYHSVIHLDVFLFYNQ